MSEPNDLLNDPSRPACGCDYCIKHPSAWVEGSILARVRRAVAATYIDRGTRNRARLYQQLNRKDAS